jgi:hypothetical protein
VRSRIGKGYAAIAVIAVAVALLGISMTAPVVSTTADFSIYNSGWNGVSDLAVLTYKTGKFAPTFEVRATGTEISIAHLGLERIALDPLTSALVIIGPMKAFSTRDGTIVGDFVRNGGRLLLADDFGTGNGLLEHMGATSRFSGLLVMDLAYEKKPEFSVCFDIRADTLTRNISTVLLNYPSSLTINSTTTQVLAYSSVASWLDSNTNRNQEWGEPRGPFPILARERMGNGEIVLLSDPSALINGMSEYMNNSALGENLIGEMSVDRSEVFFDESHRDYFDPVSITTELTGEISPEGRFAIVALVFVLTLWMATDLLERATALITRKTVSGTMRITYLLGLRRKAKPVPVEPLDIEKIVDEVVSKHPDWRTGLVRYLLREAQRHGKTLEERRLRKDLPHAVQNDRNE